VIRTTRLHEGWEVGCPDWFAPPGRLGCSSLEWLPARVPGHVHADLVAAGVIGDPFAGLQELGCQWVDGARWSYRTTFTFTPHAELPKRLLRFEGLDTIASVWLDGVRIGESDNMFVPLEIDVSARLGAGTHELRVDFESAVAVGNERRARYLAAEGLPRDVVRFDERGFVRKAQYMYGWDWGPRLVSAGIWQPVLLVEHAGRILDVLVEQVHLPDGSVELKLFSECEGVGEIEHEIEGVAGSVLDGVTVRFEEPPLWWPRGMGPQTLLTVRSRFVDRHDPNGPRVLDERTMRFGLRRVRLVREPDRHGESFELEVNGRRVYCVGANWIPDDSFPALIDRERLRAALGRAVDLEMNMLRVWGGGLYESDDFYSLADELGLLIWQDFPYACSYYPEDGDALKVARREARENVRRLRSHPSLVLWCGNNENRMMFEQGWEDPKRHPPRYYGEKIYEHVLPQVLAELDPTRPYIPTSPWGGSPSNSGGTGDQHYWEVWHGRGDWKFYEDSTARFSSEFGFAAAPTLAGWRRIYAGGEQPLDLDVHDRAARFHDKTAKGYDVFTSLVELHYPVAKNLEEWTYFSQLNQRDALRHGIEHYRRSEFCKGTLIWQLNDCWPVQSWAVVDSEGGYKAAAFELRRLYAPALASLVVADGAATLFTVLDNASERVAGTAWLEARSLLDGRSLARVEVHVELAPGERKPVLDLELGAFVPEETLVVGGFGESRTFRLLSEPKHARLVTPRLVVSPAASGLVVTTDRPVVDLWLWDPSGALELTDNFVTLSEAGSVRLRAHGTLRQLEARSLAGRHAVELVHG